MNKQDLKDHSLSTAFGSIAAATGVVAAVATGAEPFVVVASVVCVAVVAAASDKAPDFKPLSAIGGAILSAVAIFGVSNHYGMLEQYDAMEPSENGPSSEMVIDQKQYSDVAQYFNANNDHPHVTAEINQQGNYVLNVQPRALSL